MSTMNAKSHARKAQHSHDVEEKLTELAKAIYELARSIDTIETKVGRL